jgi:hypothetical protein
MRCFSIAVLRVLDQKHHKEGDDRRGGVDDQLPGIGKMKRWSGDNPDKNDEHGSGKSPGAPEGDRRMAGENAKCVAYHAKDIPLLSLFGLAFHCQITLPSHAILKMVANNHRRV